MSASRPWLTGSFCSCEREVTSDQRTDASALLVAVKMMPAGRVHVYTVDDAAVLEARPGTPVVVQEDGMTAFGAIVGLAHRLNVRRMPPGDVLQRVVRLATREDVSLRSRQHQREREAFRAATLKIREHGLGMRLSHVEQAFDGSRLVFFFTADVRVDFRDLVRELAADFHARIEMRQIGVRDEAKMLGGYGTCGRPMCCTTFLCTFEPVSIKMAKQQDLTLNPAKLSGLCGRLKCCLRFELSPGAGAAHAGCGCEHGGGCMAGEASRRSCR